MLGSGFTLVLGYLLVSRIETIWQLYLFYGVITGAGLNGCIVPLTSTVATWFTRRRALMTGILHAGPALGIVVLPPTFSLLISAYDWRISYVILGSLVFTVIISLVLF